VNPGNFLIFYFFQFFTYFFAGEKKTTQGNETNLVEWEGVDLRRRFRNPFRLRQKKRKKRNSDDFLLSKEKIK
jgi:hypothetical protein